MPSMPRGLHNEGSTIPVQIQLQVREDEFVLDELPDDSGHFISLHLHHRASLDLLGHIEAWWWRHNTQMLKTSMKNEDLTYEKKISAMLCHISACIYVYL